VLIGYARVSSLDQSPDRQRDALAKAGCQKIYEDKISGTRAARPGLDQSLAMLREGDGLVVWKLDRLGRGVRQLVDLVTALHQRDVQFTSLTMPSTPARRPAGSSSMSWPAWPRWNET
jgi:DNA invertase Pin-like site-specific DNA recombinase